MWFHEGRYEGLVQERFVTRVKMLEEMVVVGQLEWITSPDHRLQERTF